MDLFTFLLCKKKGGGGGGGLTYTLSADTVNKQIVLTPSEGDAQAITVPYATDASTVNGKDVPELENGKIPAAYLPSYVDDVLEYDDLAHFPAEGEVGKIYVARDTSLIYRWGGSMYAEINQSLALGETEATAYRGDRGKIAYDHSQSAHAPSNAEANQNAFSNITVGDTTIEADSKTDTLTLEAGNNITLTPDASTDKVTITATDTTYSDATTSVSGLMSGSDKTKLNGIATGAEVNQNTFSNVKIGSTTVAADSKTDTLELEAGDNIELTPDSTNDKITISGIPVTKTIRDVSIASFSDGGNAPIPSLTASIVPVQAGSGDPSPTNVRPISGWTEEVITRTGKNFLPLTVKNLKANNTDGTWNGNTYTLNSVAFTVDTNESGEVTGIKASGIATNNTYIILDNNFDSTKYTGWIINGLPSNGGSGSFLFRVASQDSWSSLADYQTGTGNVLIDSGSGKRLGLRISNGYQANDVMFYPMIRQSSESAEFEPFGTSTTIPFTDGQGQSVEVFGGEIDVINGVVTPCPYYASYNGEQLIGEWISDRDVYSPNTTPTTGAQVVNIGATGTPFSVQPTSIKSLDGDNNVFASTGPLREVTYRTQAYGDFVAQKDLPDAISDIKTLKLDENQILIGDGSFDKIGIFMDDYYDENLDTTFSTEVTPQEIYLTSQPSESVDQTAIITSDKTEYQTSLLSGTEVINTVNAIGMEVNVKENGSTIHGIKIVSGDVRLLGSDTWDGTNTSLKNALATIQNNLYIANYNKTASLSSGSNTVALDMTGYIYNGSDIVNVYVDGLYKINNTDYTITVNDSTGVASINYTAAAAGTMAIQVIKPKIGFTALTDNNGNNVTDSNGNSIDI